MADYNSLNKAKARNNFNIVFKKQVDLNNAIMELIRTAYINHHEETDLRNIKLYECLESRAKVIIDQIYDDNFVENIKDEIQRSVSRNINIKQIDKQKIVDEINAQIEKKRNEINENSVRNKVSSTEHISVQNKVEFGKEHLNELLNNKKFLKNVSVFTLSNTKRHHQSRINILKREFKVSGVRLNGGNTSRIRYCNIGFGKKTFPTDTIRTLFSNRIVKSGGILEKIVKIGREKNAIKGKPRKNKISRRIRSFSNIKGVIKDKLNGNSKFKKLFSVNKKKKKNKKKSFSIVSFAGSVFGGLAKTVGFLVGGLVFGLFQVVTGFLKITLNVFKFAIKGIIGISKMIFKTCGKIIKGLGKLTAFTVNKLKRIILTPVGMYYTGYVVGFIYGKIKQKWDVIHGYYERTMNKVKEIKDQILLQKSKFIIAGSDFLIKHKDDIISTINVIKKIPDATIKVLDKFVSVDHMLDMFKKGATVAAGTMVGAIIGRIVGSFFGPGLGAGIGTGLGAVAGMIISESLEKVPETSKEKLEQVKALININKKHSTRNEKKTSGTQKYAQEIDSKITSLDTQISKKTKKLQNEKDSEKKKKLQSDIDELNKKKQQMKKKKEMLGYNDRYKLIEYEDRDEYEKHQEDIENSMERLDVYRQIDSIYKQGLIQVFLDGFHGYSDNFLDPIIASEMGFRRFAISDAVKRSKLLKNKLETDYAKMTVVNIQRIKAAAIERAINLYTRSIIPYNEIGKVAEQLADKMYESIKIDGKSLPEFIRGYDEKNSGGWQKFKNATSVLTQVCDDYVSESGINDRVSLYEDQIIQEANNRAEQSKQYADSFIQKLEQNGIYIDEDKKKDIYQLYQDMFRNSSKIDEQRIKEISRSVGEIVFSIDETAKSVDNKEVDIEKMIAKSFADVATAMKSSDPEMAKLEGAKIQDLKLAYGLTKEQYVPSKEIENLKERKLTLQNKQNELLSELNRLSADPIVSIIENINEEEKERETDPNEQNLQTGPLNSYQKQNIYPYSSVGSQYLNGLYK